MLTKPLRTISLLLPLMAISASAYAGATISDKRYWPNEARRTTYDITVPQADPSSAFASTVTTPRFQVAPRADESASGPRHHGGPKSSW